MNPIEESIYQYINNIIEISEEQEPLLIQYCRMFSAVITTRYIKKTFHLYQTG